MNSFVSTFSSGSNAPAASSTAESIAKCAVNEVGLLNLAIRRKQMRSVCNSQHS